MYSAGALFSNSKLKFYSSILTLVIALLVLIGWSFDIRVLKSVLPDYITMKVNTALCFALLASTLLLLASPRISRFRKYAGAVCLAVVVMISTLTLLEYLLGTNFGIDEFLIADPEGVTGRFPPGRLAPITAINFILLSASLSLRFFPQEPRFRASQFLVGLAFIASLQGLVGYGIGLTYLFGSAFYTQMAVHTTVAFILLCLGLLSTQAKQGYLNAFTSSLSSSRMARQMLVAIVLSPIIVRWLASFGFRHGIYDEDFSSLIQVMGNIVIMGVILIRTSGALFQIEQEREVARSNAETANRAKTNFIANISHELRTPLGAVLGFSEILANGEAPASERDTLTSSIKRNGDQLLRLIDDLLEISKIEAGHLQIEKTDVSLPEFLDDVAAVAKLKGEEKQVTFEVKFLSALPEKIFTDSTRLRQVLLNVIGNGIKFNEPQGKVGMTMQFMPSTPPMLRFSIKDTGPGITGDAAKRLFEPFSQADASLTRKYGGTGLGLALSKKIAQALGGDLNLMESIEGKGSEFALDVDPGELASLKLADFTRLPKAPSPAVGVKQAAAILKNVRILLVEDSPDNQALITRYLNGAGAVVEVANDGVEGVTKALHGAFDLVLMDLQMPNLDGYDAIKKLRGIGYRVPVIALTAHALREDRERSLNAGFVAHLTKPVNKRLLLHTIESYVTRVG